LASERKSSLLMMQRKDSLLMVERKSSLLIPDLSSTPTEESMARDELLPV
jgi:hypothetical protein